MSLLNNLFEYELGLDRLKHGIKDTSEYKKLKADSSVVGRAKRIGYMGRATLSIADLLPRYWLLSLQVPELMAMLNSDDIADQAPYSLGAIAFLEGVKRTSSYLINLGNKMYTNKLEIKE